MTRVSLPLRAAAELELRRRRKLAAATLPVSPIPAEMTFRQWCESLAGQGLKVDGHPFTLSNRQALWEIYDQRPLLTRLSPAPSRCWPTATNPRSRSSAGTASP